MHGPRSNPRRRISRACPARPSTLRWHRPGRRAVSDVVATILLLALTVTLFASIFAWVTAFPAPPSQNNNQFKATLSYTSSGLNISGLQVTHLAGPSIPGNALVYLKSAIQPSAPEFAKPYTVSSQSLSYATVSGFSTWNLGQTWSVVFTNTPADLPSALGNITVYIVSASQLLFSVILPGAATTIAPTVVSTWVSPASPSIGQAFTVNATLAGSYNPAWVYVSLASLPGASGKVEARMSQNAQGVWYFQVNAGNTSGATAGTYYAIVNTSSITGQGAAAAVVITISSSGGGGSNGPLSVGVVLVPTPPNAGVTESVQAVITYTSSSASLGLSVAFSGTSTGGAACGSYSGSSPSGLTITGPSSVTVVSQTSWVIPSPAATLCPYTFSATATVGTLTPVTGTVSFTPALLTVSAGSFAVGGTTPVATGQSFVPSTGVNLTLAGVAVVPTFTSSTGTCPELGATGAILTSTVGGFSCSFTVPSEPTHGALALYANDSATGEFDSTTFTVTASTITANPTSGDIGGTITTVTGAAFAHSQSISFTLGGVTAASSCTSGGTGAFTCSVTVPAAPTGAQTLVASDGTNSGSTTYTVYADPTVAVTPVTSPVYYDIGQTATALTASKTYSGPNTATMQWYKGSSPTCSSDTTTSGTSSAGATLTLTPADTATGTTYYCTWITDSGVTGYVGYSNVIQVTVSSTLTAPAAPVTTVTSTTTQTVVAVLRTTGTSTYSWAWYTSTNGGTSYTASTTCSVNSGSGAIGGTTVTCLATGLSSATTYLWEVKVTDSATTPVTVTSAASTGAVGKPFGGTERTGVASSVFPAALGPLPEASWLAPTGVTSRLSLSNFPGEVQIVARFVSGSPVTLGSA